MKDVAADAVVSISTVSRVLHGQPVQADMRDRVLASIAKLKYRPNQAAQSMRTRSSRLVACALRGVLMPEMSVFVRSAEAVFRASGYNLLLTGLDEEADRQREVVEMLAGRGIDGLLLTPAAIDADSLEKAIRQLGAPTIVVDRDLRAGSGLIGIDHAGGIRQAVDHLATLGHKRIGLLTLPATMRPGRERVTAFKEAISAHKLTLTNDLISDRNLESDNCFYEATAMLTGRNAPTAIIAGGMSLLPGVLRAIESTGRKIGEDIALIAGSDSELAALKTPAITAIRWNMAEWGSLAAKMLLEYIEDGADSSAAPRQLILPTELVLRPSTLKTFSMK